MALLCAPAPSPPAIKQRAPPAARPAPASPPAANDKTGGKRTDDFNHFKAMAEAIQGLTWVVYQPNVGMPAPPAHVAECWQARSSAFHSRAAAPDNAGGRTTLARLVYPAATPLPLPLPRRHRNPLRPAHQTAEFYTNKVLMQYKGKDDKHVAWVAAAKELFLGLRDYCKKHHTTGPQWNAKGVDLAHFMGGGAAPAAAAGADSGRE